MTTFHDKLAVRRQERMKQIPLDDESCGRWSIYLRAKDGSLWTITRDEDKKYRQVRPADPTVVPDDMFARKYYVCVCCGAESDKHDPFEHKTDSNNQSIQLEQLDLEEEVNKKLMQKEVS